MTASHTVVCINLDVLHEQRVYGHTLMSCLVMHLVTPAGTVCSGTPLAPAEGLSSILRPLLAAHPPNPLPSSAPVCADAPDQLCYRCMLLHRFPC